MSYTRYEYISKRRKSPLPDPRTFPYQLVRIIVWEQDDKKPTRGHGTVYVNSGDLWQEERKGWQNPRINREMSEGESWEFYGFNIDSFNSSYLINEDKNTPEDVLEAMFILQEWADREFEKLEETK